MQLEYLDKPPVRSPDADTLRDALRWAPGKTDSAVAFVRDDGSFVQVEFLDERRVCLECCDFSSGQSRRCPDERLPEAQLTEVFTRFAAGDPTWPLAAGWYDVPVVPKKTPPHRLSLDGSDPVVTRQLYRRIRWTRWFTFGAAVNAVGALVFAVRSRGPEQLAWATTFVSLTLVTLLLHRIGWRCPACGRPLPRRPGSFCFRCGARLR